MTVLKGVDSWQEPTAAQIATAKANGISVWAGYFKIGNDGIYHGWTDATFRLVQAGGLHTLAFCSTRADPAALKARAAALGIVIVADVESSVNGGDGPTVDPWLAASGAHLYGGGPRGDGTIPRHLPHGHTAYMVADYEQRPGWGTASWPIGDPKPNAPVAWQYAGGGSHPWGNTDLAIYDEAFVTPGSAGADMTPAQAAQLAALYEIFFSPYEAGGAPWSNAEVLRRMLAALGAPYSPSSALPFVPTPVAPGTGLTAEQAAALAAIPGLVATVDAIAAKVGKDLA